VREKTRAKAALLWVRNNTAEIGDAALPIINVLIWLDEGMPRALLDVKDVVYGADVQTYVRAKDP
jgi:hypothetical protein